MFGGVGGGGGGGGGANGRLWGRGPGGRSGGGGGGKRRRGGGRAGGRVCFFLFLLFFRGATAPAAFAALDLFRAFPSLARCAGLLGARKSSRGGGPSLHPQARGSRQRTN